MKQLKRTWRKNPNFVQNAATQQHSKNMDRF
jgi:hypothetical protein